MGIDSASIAAWSAAASALLLSAASPVAVEASSSQQAYSDASNRSKAARMSRAPSAAQLLNRARRVQKMLAERLTTGDSRAAAPLPRPLAHHAVRLLPRGALEVLRSKGFLAAAELRPLTAQVLVPLAVEQLRRGPAAPAHIALEVLCRAG